MAYVEMGDSVNMSELNLNWLYQNAWNWGLLDNAYLTLYGDTYEDIYAVDWSLGGVSLGSIFGGYGMTTGLNDYPAGGTTTGYLETYFDSSVGYIPYFGIRGTSVPTNDVWNAAITSDTTDDYVLIRQMLSGNDTLVGSPYDDYIYAYAGNDSISASGGSDIVVGGDGTDTYVANTVTSGAVNISEQNGTYTVVSGAYGTDYLIDVENISLGDGTYSLASFNQVNTREFVSEVGQSDETTSDSPSIDSESNSLTLIANVFGSILFLENLTEVNDGNLHTIGYNGNTFNYSDIDSIVTIVVRNGEFTDEFIEEIAESFPDAAGVSYSTALALIGQANIESTLMMVAGADGNYVG